MRQAIFLIIILFIGGCAFIVQEYGELKKPVGIKREDASKLLTEIEQQKPGNLRAIPILMQKESPQQPQKIK